MSKKTSESGIERLKADGQLTITADSRQEIYEQAEALVAAIPQGVEWTRTIVEHQDGRFSQTYFIIKKD